MAGIADDVRFLLSLDLHAVRANIYLEALWLLSILIEIESKHSDHNDQCSDDQKQHVPIAEHWYPFRITTAPSLAVALSLDLSGTVAESC
jgi:hypothetical protein